MKYNEIMDKVEVTDEMKKRILANISKRPQQQERSVRKIPYWKWIGSLAACAAIVILSVTVLPYVTNSSRPENGDVAVVNGIIECGNLEELSQKSGFEIKEPANIPFEVVVKKYTSLFGTTAQIEYIGNSNSIVFRVSETKDDISGDYNTYERVREESISDNKVTLKGNGDMEYLAIWYDGRYSYALSASEGISFSEMSDMISANGDGSR